MASATIAPRTQLPLPSFYDPANAARWSYRPDEQAVIEEALVFSRRHALRASAKDAVNVHLLLIDVQKDFCFPEGSLFVGGRSGRGAIGDNARIAEFLYRNLGTISHVTCTMDTHFPFQIFFPVFWKDADGRTPPPHTVISTEDVRAGRYLPNPAIARWLGGYEFLLNQVRFYCEELERAGKYQLYLWPPHCLLGGEGHPLAGVIHEARLFHAAARGSRAAIETKGANALTENYSVLAPEVLLRWDGRGNLPGAQRNAPFIERLRQADVLVVAGQAASHCVRSSIEDLLADIAAHDPALARKVYLLEDCMSAVAVPDPARPGHFLADFTPQAEDALRRFAAAGMHVVRSTDAMEDWPEPQS